VTLRGAVPFAVALLALLIPAGAVARADDGAAVPKQQEKAKRKEKKPTPAPAKVFTDDDLKKYAEERAAKAKSEGDDSAQGTADSSQSYASAPEPDAPAQGDNRQVWADKARQARERVAAIETRMATLEARIAELRNDRGAAGAMDPFRLQTIQGEIQKATEEFEASRKERDQAQAALDAVIEDARREGVPAGWVREP
jgi:hypothetical protein